MTGNNGIKERYVRDGFAIGRQLLPERQLADLETTLINLVEVAVEKLEPGKRPPFHGMDRRELLHRGLLQLEQVDNRLVKDVVDTAWHSFSLHRIATHPRILKTVASLIDQPSLENINICDTFLRADYPLSNAEHIRRLHLPYHQESGYYEEKISLLTGVVIWIPLFDCGSEEGSLKVRVGSHRVGHVNHESYYENPDAKKHLRVRLPEAQIDEFPEATLEVRRGDVVFQNFFLFHRSGDNVREHRVRYTVIARMSCHTAPDYVSSRQN